MGSWRSPRAAVWVGAASVVAGLLTWLALTPQSAEALMSESGPVERVTAAGFALAAFAAWLVRRPGDDWRSALALSVMWTGASMRELDLHKTLTDTSVLRLSWYWSPAPLSAKATAALATLSVALAIGWLLWRHWRRLWHAATRGDDPVGVTVVVALVVLVVSKVLDRSVGMLVDFGLEVPLRWVALRSALEEWMELGLVLLSLLGCVQHRWGTRRAG
jgi:hypothetical protein